MKSFPALIYISLFAICATSVFIFNPYIKYLAESPPRGSIHDWHDGNVARWKILSQDKYFFGNEKKVAEFGGSPPLGVFNAAQWPRILIWRLFDLVPGEIVFHGISMVFIFLTLVNVVQYFFGDAFSIRNGGEWMKMIWLGLLGAGLMASLGVRQNDSPFYMSIPWLLSKSFVSMKKHKSYLMDCGVGFLFFGVNWPLGLGLSGLAVIAVSTCILGAYVQSQRKELFTRLVFLLSGALAAFMVTHWRQLLLFLNPEFISSRKEFVVAAEPLLQQLKNFYKFDLDPIVNASHQDLFPLVLTSLLGIWICWKDGLQRKIYISIVIGALFIFLLSILLWCEESRQLLSSINCNNIQLWRIRYGLVAVLIFLACLALGQALRKPMQKGFVIAGSVLIGWTIYNLHQANDSKAENNQAYLDLNRYYSTQAFNQIKSLIGPSTSQTRVGCLGIHPAIAQYHGLYTVDFYLPNYDLGYKHKFRKIITKELEKDNKFNFKDYFDQWGSRAYLFCAEYGNYYLTPRDMNREINKGTPNEGMVADWGFDPIAFQKLGGRYIISIIPLADPEKNGLKVMGSVLGTYSFWDFWIYEII